MGLIGFLFRRERQKTLSKLYKTVDVINSLEAKYHALSDEELIAQTDILRNRYKDGEKLDVLLCDAFAVVREASLRAAFRRTAGGRYRFTSGAYRRNENR